MCIRLITLAMLCGRIDVKEEENRIKILIDGREEYVTSYELVLALFQRHFATVYYFVLLCTTISSSSFRDDQHSY